MNTVQGEWVRGVVASVFNSMTAAEIDELVMSSYAELREELRVPLAA